MKPLQVFVRDVVAPILRAHGFKRSGGTFRKVTEAGVAVISVSGRGGIALTDLDFDVGVGFATRDDLGPDARPELYQPAIGRGSWQGHIDDPAVEVPMGQKWRFNLDNVAAEACFRAVLDQAAEDLLARLHAWPETPQDSFSRTRVFRRPVDPGERPEYQAVIDQFRASIETSTATGMPWPERSGGTPGD